MTERLSHMTQSPGRHWWRYSYFVRVAWRILKDWVAAQLAIVETEMVSLDEVMLPYLRSDDGRTLYELFTERQLALTTGEGA